MSEKKLLDGFYYLWSEFYKNKNLELSNDIGFSDANETLSFIEPEHNYSKNAGNLNGSNKKSSKTI